MRGVWAILTAITLLGCAKRTPDPGQAEPTRPRPVRPEVGPPGLSEPALPEPGLSEPGPPEQGEELPEAETAPSVELAAPHHRCGVERADVKIGIDEAAAAVDLDTPRETTIAALGAKPKPPHVTNHMPRDNDTERTVFVLRDVHLTLYKEEGGANGDHDFHLVVKDTEHRSMVAEIPEAECMLSSPWRRYVRDARATVDGRLHPTGAFQPVHDHVVSVVGVGFFDRIHGQKGHASNGIELHPVLDICFGVGCRLGRAWQP